MVQEALVGELLEQLLSGSGDEQASAAQTVCELCCERRGYTQARRSGAHGTAALRMHVLRGALPENMRPLCMHWADRQHRQCSSAKPSVCLKCW